MLATWVKTLYTVGITHRLFGYFTANDMRLTTLRPVPYAQSELRGVACIASVSARVRRERRDESKRRGTLAPFAPALTFAQWLDWKRLLRRLFAEGKNRTACKLFSRLFAAFSCVLSSRIFENVTAKWTFCVQKFVFGQKLSPSNHYKAKSVTIAFFSSPFLFLRWCDFGANRAQETCLMTHFTQMVVNFVRLVVKTSPARYTFVYIVFIKFSWVVLYLNAVDFLDLLQVDLLASGASLFFWKSMDFLFLVVRIALTVQCIFLFKEHTAPFPRFSHLVRALCSSLSVSTKSQI